MDDGIPLVARGYPTMAAVENILKEFIPFIDVPERETVVCSDVIYRILRFNELQSTKTTDLSTIIKEINGSWILNPAGFYEVLSKSNIKRHISPSRVNEFFGVTCTETSFEISGRNNNQYTCFTFYPDNDVSFAHRIVSSTTMLLNLDTKVTPEKCMISIKDKICRYSLGLYEKVGDDLFTRARIAHFLAFSHFFVRNEACEVIAINTTVPDFPRDEDLASQCVFVVEHLDTFRVGMSIGEITDRLAENGVSVSRDDVSRAIDGNWTLFNYCGVVGLRPTIPFKKQYPLTYRVYSSVCELICGILGQQESMVSLQFIYDCITESSDAMRNKVKSVDDVAKIMFGMPNVCHKDDKFYLMNRQFEGDILGPVYINAFLRRSRDCSQLELRLPKRSGCADYIIRLEKSECPEIHHKDLVKPLSQMMNLPEYLKMMKPRMSRFGVELTNGVRKTYPFPDDVLRKGQKQWYEFLKKKETVSLYTKDEYMADLTKPGVMGKIEEHRIIDTMLFQAWSQAMSRIPTRCNGVPLSAIYRELGCRVGWGMLDKLLQQSWHFRSDGNTWSYVNSATEWKDPCYRSFDDLIMDTMIKMHNKRTCIEPVFTMNRILERLSGKTYMMLCDDIPVIQTVAPITVYRHMIDDVLSRLPYVSGPGNVYGIWRRLADPLNEGVLPDFIPWTSWRNRDLAVLTTSYSDVRYIQSLMCYTPWLIERKLLMAWLNINQKVDSNGDPLPEALAVHPERKSELPRGPIRNGQSNGDISVHDEILLRIFEDPEIYSLLQSNREALHVNLFFNMLSSYADRRFLLPEDGLGKALDDHMNRQFAAPNRKETAIVSENVVNDPAPIEEDNDPMPAAEVSDDGKKRKKHRKKKEDPLPWDVPAKAVWKVPKLAWKTDAVPFQLLPLPEEFKLPEIESSEDEEEEDSF